MQLTLFARTRFCHCRGRARAKRSDRPAGSAVRPAIVLPGARQKDAPISYRTWSPALSPASMHSPSMVDPDEAAPLAQLDPSVPTLSHLPPLVCSSSAYRAGPDDHEGLASTTPCARMACLRLRHPGAPICTPSLRKVASSPHARDVSLSRRDTEFLAAGGRSCSWRPRHPRSAGWSAVPLARRLGWLDSFDRSDLL